MTEENVSLYVAPGVGTEFRVLVAPPSVWEEYPEFTRVWHEHLGDGFAGVRELDKLAYSQLSALRSAANLGPANWDRDPPHRLALITAILLFAAELKIQAPKRSP